MSSSRISHFDKRKNVGYHRNDTPGNVRPSRNGLSSLSETTPPQFIQKGIAIMPDLDQSSRSRRRSTLRLAVAGLIAIAACAWGLGRGDAGAVAAPARRGTPVDVAMVVSRNIIDWRDYSGRLEAVGRVEIRPQVSGILTAVHFKDGSLVKKGEVLFTIDPRPYAAAVERAQAQLASASAHDAYAASELARSKRLVTDDAVSRKDFEERQNDARQAAASVLDARAALRIARLNLEYTQIRAPITGRISRAEVTIGNLVTAGESAPLTTLVSSGELYASFDVDEKDFLRYVDPAGSAVDAALPVYLGLSDESGYPRKGRVSSIDNRLDPSSGTIRVRAVFGNPDGRLVPGLYARIRLGGDKPHNAVLIDEKAVGTDQNRRFVLVLDKENKALYREVHLGATQDGLTIVTDGLQSGERIVVNGLQRVHPGDRVEPHTVSMDVATKASGSAG